MKIKSILFLLLSSLLFNACKKQNDKPQWDVEVLGPVLFASLSLENLMVDTLLQTNVDGSASLIVEQSFYNLEPDSIYTIPDTTIFNLVRWPIFTTSITPGFTFPPQNNKINLGVGNVHLTKAILRDGIIDIVLKNNLPEKLIYTYSIPKAKKQGVAFTIVQEVEAATSSGPGSFTNSFSLAGYELDLTGLTGSQFNTLGYTLAAVSDPNGNSFLINFNNIVIDIASTLRGIEPAYVKGYLGQNTITESVSNTTGLATFVKGGFIQLDSVSLDLDIDNFIGADAQIFFNSITAINNRTFSSVQLSAPTLLNRALNINRSQESGPPLSPVIPTHHNFRFDNANSNLKEFVENLPERISASASLNLNPLGNNFSLYTDFLYRDFLVNGTLTLKMPFRFATQDLLLVDTQDVSLDELTNLDPIGPLTLTLIAKNGFPVDFDLQLFMIDGNRNITDSLLIPGLIKRANIDSQYKVTTPFTTQIEIPVDELRKNNIRTSKYMCIRSKFNTPDYPQQIQLYSTYKLDLKLIANGTYYIR